jgi:hypothetical protein
MEGGKVDNDNKELQLEQVAERAIQNAEKLNLAPPIFELYAALLSMSLAIIMFLFPELLAGRGGFYGMMTSLLPQGGWAIGFFLGGVLSAVGMLFDKRALRIVSLFIMAILYGTLTAIYGMLLPNFGFILMLWITIFTVASMPLTKYTGIWNKPKGSKEK